jgi:CHAD domain-containing protein
MILPLPTNLAMAYKLHLDESVATGVHRIGREQIEKAITEIDDTEMDRHEKVHQVRKRCKKMRGLLRLIRPVFPEFKEENESFRDSARELSYVRDSQSMLECLDTLSTHYRTHVDAKMFKTIVTVLERRRERIAGDGSRLETKLERFRSDMLAALERLQSWGIDSEGFEAVEGGLRKTYRRAKKELAKAFADPTSENFHQWRKRVKYHWYHTRLLHDLWPEMLTVHIEAADDLSNILGDEHDLSVLQKTILEDVEPGNRGAAIQVIQRLIYQRRKQLQVQARIIGLRIFAETPKQLTGRFGSYWQVI